MNCADIQDRLAAYVDGEVNGHAAAIRSHVDGCASCRALVHAQVTARAVIKARAAALSPAAPPGLRTRLRALTDERAAAGPAAFGRSFGWTRLSAFAAALLVVVAVGGAVLPFATARSATLLAAQLALDHLKCFVIDGEAGGTPISKADAEATLQREYGFAASVPASLPAARLELMAVRRCLYGDGLAAHVLYRIDGRPLSLFILPRTARASATARVLGQHEMSWTTGERTYILVAAGGSTDALSRVAPYVRDEAK